MIGGSANRTSAKIYSIQVARDAGNHIIGFSGTATFFANASRDLEGSGGIDGGLAYGPSDELFYTTYDDNTIGQLNPGSTVADRVIELTPLGVASSTGSLAFVPPGFPGAGRLKIASYDSGDWYDATVSADGSGTFDILGVTQVVNIGGGPEGIVYVSAGNPSFSVDSILVSEFDNNRVVTYEIDGNGDPIPATQRDFITGLEGAEGAFIDPLTGDFLFSTFGSNDRVIVVQGFIAPAPPVGRDCNGNLVPDECDIESGFSDDCNTNGFPDECEDADPCPE